jgi:hypothetical protein
LPKARLWRNHSIIQSLNLFLTREETGKLLSLLGSENRDNAQVAVAILEGMGLYRAFMTDLFIQALYEPDGHKRAFFTRCIDNIVPKELSFLQQGNAGFLGALTLREDSSIREIQKTAMMLKLDGPVLLRFLQSKRVEFLKEVWNGPDSSRRRNILNLHHYIEEGKSKMLLQGLRLQELPSEIFEFQGIEVLDLRGNRFERLPANLSQLPNLRKVDMQGNLIQDLPGEPAFPANLELVDLRDNPIEIDVGNAKVFHKHPIIKADIGERTLAMLRGSLEHQRLALPVFIENRENGIALNLAGLMLRKVPDGVFELHQIEILNLENNMISELPGRLVNLPRLRIVNVINNHNIRVTPRLRDNFRIKVIGPANQKPTGKDTDFLEAISASRVSSLRRMLKYPPAAETPEIEPYRPTFDFEIP